MGNNKTKFFISLIQEIFSDSIISCKLNVNASNNVISALYNDQNSIFFNNFISRLKRLENVYHNHDSQQKLIDIIKRLLDSSTWEGAFAELVTLDYFHSKFPRNNNLMYKPIEINNIASSDSLLLKNIKDEKREVELDGYFPDCNVFFDTKILRDNVDHILLKIYKEVQSEFSQKQVLIVSEYNKDTDWDELSTNRTKIKKELIDAINQKTELTYLKSKVVSHLTHRLKWGGGILISASTYSPFKHAQEFYLNVFKDCHQFIKNKPIFLVYVNFPWYNNTITDFREDNKTFYRSVARRVFCGAKENSQNIKGYLKNITDFKYDYNIPLSEVSKCLSGILFLEDKSIMSENASEHNILSYFYSNPNAHNKLTESMFFDYMSCDLQLDTIDTFEYDNY